MEKQQENTRQSQQPSAQERSTIEVSPDELLNLAKKAHQNGMVQKAQEFYETILKINPDNAEAMHFLGILKHQLGYSNEGLELIRKSIDAAPDESMMHNNLGNVLRELDRNDEAETAYRAALKCNPDDPDALCNLGVSLHNQKKNDEAISFLRQAIEQNSKHGESYHNLGNLYREQRQFDEAIDCYEKAVEFQGYNQGSNRSVISLALVLASSGKRAAAEQVLNDMLTRQPGNPVGLHMLAALTGKNIPKRASNGYVVEAFQSFASTFDENLARLNYQAPELVGNHIKNILPQPAAQYKICDLGCGTGLVAQYIKPYANKLIGVDLSVNMLIQARKRLAYDDLVEAEITEFLKQSVEKFDLITCVDTLCYLGELEDILNHSGHSLVSGGHLCFTVEKLAEDAEQEHYALAHHGRYQHKQTYLDQLLQQAGYSPASFAEVVLRKESGKPVKGLLVCAQKT